MMLMQEATGTGDFLTQNAALIETILQLLLIIVPFIITWYIRTYVKGTAAQKEVAAVIHLANAAIDYAENLDKRGTLQLPPDVSKGLYKLTLAGDWMEQELTRIGISITSEEAQKWIASEFQKRVGGVQMASSIAESSRAAVQLVQSLERSGLVQIPTGVDRVFHLAELAADWLVVQLAHQGASVEREEALIWVRAELLNSVQSLQDDNLPVNERLNKLAKQAVVFLQELKASGRLAISGENVETDIITGWLLTEAAKQGLAVTPRQIKDAVAVALRF